jgi:hypothetical protein
LETRATALESINQAKSTEKNVSHANNRGSGSVENMVRTSSQGDEDCGSEELVDCKNGGEDAGIGENVSLNDEIRKVVGEILDICEGTFIDLASVLALRICEDIIPHQSYGDTYRIVTYQ